MNLKAKYHHNEGLQLNLLGTPRILVNGEPLMELKSVKTQALLFYLAVSRRAHTRPELAGLLWGDMPESAARANLSKSLSLLRSQLRETIIIERNAVSLAGETEVWVDVVDFDKIFQDATETGTRDRLQHAVGLYRGDFLEGFFVPKAPEFERWWLLERSRLREQYLRCLQMLADYRVEVGNLEDAIALTRRYLALEPWREEAHRRLMLLLAQDGKRAAALVQYETCRRILAEELDTAPSESTTELFKRIQLDDLDFAPTPSADTQKIEQSGPAFLNEKIRHVGLPREPVVGRDSQLAQLNAFLERVLDGKGQIAFVSGEAGWGKTSLLFEFSRRAQELHPDLIVVSGACTTAIGFGDPYQPFREITRMLTGDVEGMWASGVISSDHAQRIWRLLPKTISALLAHGPDLIGTFVPENALLNRLTVHENRDNNMLERLREFSHRDRDRRRDSGLDQERIFEEFTDALVHLSHEQPILLILDDLHWADPSSVGLLFHLSQRIRSDRIMILGAYRPEEVTFYREDFEHPLVGLFSELKRDFGDVRLRLVRESMAESRAFVNGVIDQEPNQLGEGFRQKLAQTTKGHPLFVVETLRDMKEQGHLFLNKDGLWEQDPNITWVALPKRVEGVIEKRINRLDPRLKQLLTAASVEGEEFTVEILARIEGLDEREIVRMLSGDLTKMHRLVKAVGVQQIGRGRISRYRFSHHLFQKFLYDSIDMVERSYLHEAVGEAILSHYRDQPDQVASQLAWHFQEAGIVDKAFAFLTQAGDSAARVYANLEAIDHYRKALELGIKNEWDSDSITQLYNRLGRVLELDSQFDQALKTYQEMDDLAHQNGDLAMELASFMAQITILAAPTAVHDAIRARQIGKRAIALSEILDDREAEAKIAWSLSLANYFSGELNESIRCGERSLTLARKLDLRTQLAQTLNDLGGFIYLYSGRIDQAKSALKEARDLWVELDNSPMLADSLGGSCVAHVYAGNYDKAIAFSDRAFTISQGIDNIWGQSYSFWAIGEAYMARGEYSKAIEVMEECIRLGELASFIPPQTYTRSYLATAYEDLGLFDRALALVHLGIEISQSQIPAHNAQLLGTLARLQIKRGDLSAAEEAINAGKSELSQHSWRVFYLPVLFAEVEFARHQGELQHALGASNTLVDQLREFGMRSRLAEAEYLKGMVLMNMGLDEPARSCFLESKTIADELGARRTLWQALYALSKVENDTEKSENYYQEAKMFLDYIVDNIDQVELRQSFLNHPDVHVILDTP
jgi:DNA-binding SARP family transcriptional activator